ncbi:protein Flattop [Dunckerocampus dactyliophorus]|uniref:protein Flattop n=1 Tax=Dunckerocampus dactyliophorus TaxID=161453 RepID=UPI00240646E1|nr:protein Flattop [Dunckerocampus dactyliophorus]
MSYSFSANQYDDAFKPKRLQNWCQAKQITKLPRAHKGHTTFVADNRGHLLPGLVKKGSAWPDFKGTWDLPARTPPRSINPTSSSVEGLNRLKACGLDPQHTGNCEPQGGSKNTDGLQDAAKQSTGDVQQDDAVSTPLSTAESRPASQNRPISADYKTGSQNQDMQADEASSVTLPAGEGQTAGETVMSRPQSRRESALTSLAGRPNTGSTHSASPALSRRVQ